MISGLGACGTPGAPIWPPPGNLQKALEKHLPSKLAGGAIVRVSLMYGGGIDRQNILLRPNFPGPPNQDNS